MPQESLFESMMKNAKRIREEAPDSTPVDWEARRDWWIARVGDLFLQIEGWCGRLRVADIIDSVDREGIQVSEELLGVYLTQSLKIRLGERVLSFTPVGSVIVGGVGRVDVQGPVGAARLILNAPEDAEASDYKRTAVWFVSRRARPFEMPLLTEDTFLSLVAETMGLGPA